MVKGLTIFRERFREYSDQYLLIGGTACDLAMTEAGLEFRATKDLDIVLCIEVLNTAFVEVYSIDLMGEGVASLPYYEVWGTNSNYVNHNVDNWGYPLLDLNDLDFTYLGSSCEAYHRP